MKEVIMTLMIWVSQHTGLAFDPAQTPEVRQIPNAELANIMFSGEVPIGYNEEKLLGLFEHDKGTIYIAESIDLDSTYGKSVLLHELVHYMQFANGLHTKVMCQRELERLAYEVQREYLLENNEKPAFTDMHIVFKSMCDNGAV